jgi:isopropylmalate/homocitrate/citramalate synthase
MEQEGQALSRTEFWARVAAALFAAWAFAVPLAVRWVGNTVDDLVRENRQTREAFTAYVQAMEHRTTLIETRQEVVLRTLKDYDDRLDRLEEARTLPPRGR